MAAPIIVSAIIGDRDFAWLDGQRRAHFPPERNLLSAHLTMFHHLPPSVSPELKTRLNDLTRGVPRPATTVSGLISLGRGVAYRIDSPVLVSLRAELADAFAGLLTPQDQAGWRPHITIQNKADPASAKALLATLQADFRPRSITITGIATWWYRGGPWEPLSRHMFGS